MNSLPSASETVAVIDVGSHSVKMLVAALPATPEGFPVLIREYSEVTRLASGLQQSQKLSDTSMDHTQLVLETFTNKARLKGASRTVAVATSAVRDARNGREFIRRVRERTGLEIQVIDGGREAELIFAGVAGSTGSSGGKLLVMDVGGGSAEWIAASSGEIEQVLSLPLGCGRMTDEWFSTLPPAPGVYEKALTAVRAQLREAVCRDFKTQGRIFTGTGGTLSLLAAVDLSLDHVDKSSVDGHSLTLDALTKLVERMKKCDLAGLTAIKPIPEARASVILGGALVWQAALMELGSSSVRVSTRGLRHGILEKIVRKDWNYHSTGE